MTMTYALMKQTIRQINDAVRAATLTRVPPVVDGKTIVARIAYAASLGELINLEGGDDSAILAAVNEKVAGYDNFNEANNPHSENDFGSFTVSINDEPRQVMFKIDYYDQFMSGGSDNPANPEETVYALTIFFAEDY